METKMTSENNKTLTLSEFANRALDGQIITQEIVGGPKSVPQRVAVHVHTPTQTDLLKVQRLMVRISQVASAASAETDISDDDATLAYELGLAALAACVRDEEGNRLEDEGIVHLFAGLPYKSAVMTRCQELCGVTMITVPPLDNALALEAVKTEAAEVAKSADKLNRKARRTAKSKKPKSEGPSRQPDSYTPV